MEIIIAIALTLLASFLILWGTVQLFIFKRVKKILEEIKSQRTSRSQSAERRHRSDISETSSILAEKPEARSVLEELEVEVNEWTAERKEEIEQLQKLENYRKEFLGNVSHELKTPIFNIQGYISTLMDGGMEDKSINKTYLEKTISSVNRMIAIVDDLQTITQFEKGELELEEEKFDIVALAADVLNAQELKSKEKKVSLELLNDVLRPIMVKADKFRIRQVLVNLIVNSIRYGKENGTTTVKISDAGDKIIIEVADTGIGIAKEHLLRIFERFYRVDKSRSREMGGTGLGLAIVKHIVEAHGQSINVMSTERVGSVFSFSLKKGY